MARYVQKGNTVDYRNTGANMLPWGAVVALPTCIGIVEAEIAPGETGAMALTGVYEMNTTEAVGFGDALYWDADAGMVSKTAAENTPAGISLTEKTEAQAGTVFVRLG